MAPQPAETVCKYSGVDPEVAYGGMSISIDGASTPAHARAYTIGVNIEF